METLFQDLRYALRVLTKRPGFTIVAVLTLTLGIGANTTIFSLINALLLRPLPGVENPDRLVGVYTSDFSSTPYGSSSYPDYLDFRKHATTLDGLAAVVTNQVLNLSTGAEAELMRGALVTGGYFSVLGVKPALGRLLLPEDDETPGGHPVVVLGFDAWQRRFGADREIVGKTIILNGHSFTVVGVTARDFRGTSVFTSPDIWLPMSMVAQANAVARTEILDRRGTRWMMIVGRLKSTASLEQTQAELNTIMARLAEAYPTTNLGTLGQPDQPRPISVVAISEVMIDPEISADTRRFGYLLMAVVAFVLLIGCANIANLLLARSRGREREIAIRLALGAGRRRIIRQMITESLLLSITGGAAGLLFALWLSELLLKLNWFSAYGALTLELDMRVLAFTMLVSLLTGLLFGLAPALQASKPDLVPALKNLEAGFGTGRGAGLRGLLVVCQVTLSLVLLIGAGLFLRSLQRAYETDLGFNTDNALLASIDLSRQGYDQARGRAFYRQLTERLGSLPGVRAVTLASYIPVDDYGSRMNVTIEGYTPREGEDTELNHNEVDHNYFRAMEIPLVAGRTFSERDTGPQQRSLIINETMARRYWPDQDPVGRRVRLGAQDLEVVAVVKTGKYRDFREEPMAYMYFPFGETYRSRMTLLIRTDGDPMSFLPTLRAEVQNLDASLPLFGIKSLNEHLGEVFVQERTNALLVSLFGLLALVLAAVGIYGVVSYQVTQRRHEIGIRMALGAKSGDVLKLILRQSLKLTLIGVGAGLLGALSLTNLVASMLYGVNPTDLPTFAGVALVLIVVVLLASFIPARRAIKVDPVTVLKYE